MGDERHEVKAPPTVAAWQRRGRHEEVAGHRVFVLDLAAVGPEQAEPLVVLHGFPSSSFDFRGVVDVLRAHRRVVLLDMLGYGLSAKPDLAYTVRLQADVVVACTSMLGLSSLALLTHDMGDTVGGELLARQMEGTWPVEVTRRVVTNGSIYIEMAQLTAGQQMLLALPDEQLPEDTALDGRSVGAAVAATFSPHSPVDEEEISVVGALVAHGDGHRLLPRLIRYIEERRRSEARFTGAIESHPSPLGIVWGADDPIAVEPMAHRLLAARPDASLAVLDRVGHYPMIESPGRFAEAVARTLG